ncbi:UNKNOWN [Stylonychia lemnae]|uniref:Uncharacterized protein n=1 Tax=Stylonychia lemnae TaxID=5949 RepID=A0A078B6K9_STYLE|nr:UNKNOWN [Stylonychia lemnae]|eukprot:CDW88912.1 UNKNOWN [Stylonychia lemnae]
MVEGIYNKGLSKGKGTLMGNWYEERSLRDFTGVGRTIIREHIPKRHLNFEEPIITEKKFDITHDRIYGERKDQLMYTENFYYGKSKNPADNLPRVGRKTINQEKEMMDIIAEELRLKEEEEERQRNARQFETTTRATFQKKDLTENTIGRKVMKTQDGGLVPFSNTLNSLQ